jgi:acetoin utilization deacetylase AcuC-like enzyme
MTELARGAHEARLITCDAYREYDFGPEHPLTPRRLEVGLDLLRAAGLLGSADEVCPPSATNEALGLVHTAAYIEALQRLSQWAPLIEPLLEAEARRYGLGHGDNPLFPGAHEAAAAIAGGSLHAARLLFDHPTVRHAFHPMGGLHHAMPDRASGFCLYNDPAVAIAGAVQQFEARVLYVDFDVHHGDGVQRCFEDDPRVLTVSFHESGRFLFPGTGDVLELGRGAGRGSAINLPMAPGTADASWIEAVEAILPPLCAQFQPDLIVSQHGCDTHAWDPLAHLQLTTHSFEVQAQMLHRLAHAHCDGRWLACGGGGYDIYRVVPRSWALLWGEQTGRPIPETLPPAWPDRWQARSQRPLPERMRDTGDDVRVDSRAAEAAARQNRSTVEQVRRLAFTAPYRAIYPLPVPTTPRTAPTGHPGIARITGAMPLTRTGRMETARGSVLLRDWCPPSLVQRLRADPGLVAFTGDAARERDLLARVAAHPDTCLSLARTPDGLIVGQATISAPEGRWGAVERVFDLTFEISRSWRRLGLARALLHFCTGAPWIEDVILVAEGYHWQWDFKGTGLSQDAYRDRLIDLLKEVSFVAEATSDVDASAGVRLVRVGRRVPPEQIAAFRATLDVAE